MRTLSKRQAAAVLAALALALAGCGGQTPAAAPAPTVTPPPATSTLPAAVAAESTATVEATAEATVEATVETAATALPTWTPVVTPQPGVLAIDAGQSLGPISPYVYGTNFGPWVALRLETMPLAEQAGITVLRFPGGEWGDQNNLQPFQIDQFVDLARRMGAEPYIHVRFRDSTPENAASVVQYAKDKGYNIRFWSIGNEPSLYERGGHGWTAEEFSHAWREFADAMQAVDPEILLIGPELHQYTGTPDVDPKDSLGNDWMRTFLAINGDRVDYVSFHRYPFPNNAEQTRAKADELRANGPQWDEIIRNLRDTVREVTGRDIPVAVTEFNSHWTRSISGETSPGSLLSALWLGDVLGRLIEQRVDLAAHFLLVSGSDHSDFGLLDRYNARPPYYVYQLYKQFGQELLYSSSGIENVSVYAARREDGALTIIAINLGDNEAAAPLSLARFTPGGEAEVWRLDAEHNAEQVENVEVKDGGELLLPARSMTLYIVK